MGFGTEILFILLLGVLVLGPKRLHAVLANVARVKTRFEEASRSFKSQLTAELEATSEGPWDSGTVSSSAESDHDSKGI